MKIRKIKNDNMYLYYIATKAFSYEDFENYDDIKTFVIGYCHCSYNGNTIIINDLFVNEKYRHCNYGTTIITYVLKEAKQNNMIMSELDDMSNNYRKKNNIYLKLGYKYVNQYEPEMFLLL